MREVVFSSFVCAQCGKEVFSLRKMDDWGYKYKYTDSKSNEQVDMFCSYNCLCKRIHAEEEAEQQKKEAKFKKTKGYRIRELLLQGKSVAEIADELNCSIRYVWQISSKMGEEMRNNDE